MAAHPEHTSCNRHWRDDTERNDFSANELIHEMV